MLKFNKLTPQEIMNRDSSGDTQLFCRSCGKTVLSTYSFCPYCGTNLVANRTTKPPQPAPFVTNQIMQAEQRQNIPDFQKALAEGKTVESAFQSFTIEKESSTGIYGYNLFQSNKRICSSIATTNLNQPIRSFCIETNKTLITEYNSSFDIFSVTPGLTRAQYDICDETGYRIGIFERVFVDAPFVLQNVLHNAYILPDNRMLFYFIHNVQNEFVVVGKLNDWIAHEESDISFRYDSRSLVERRSILKVKNEYIDYLPVIFHAYVF